MFILQNTAHYARTNNIKRKQLFYLKILIPNILNLNFEPLTHSIHALIKQTSSTFIIIPHQTTLNFLFIIPRHILFKM